MKILLLILLGPVLFIHLEAKEMIPASSILNTDGTINCMDGLDGPIDFSGFGVSLDLRAGPVLTPSMVTADWNVPGQWIESGVLAMAVHNGDLYVGGCFQGVTDPDGNYLIRWDGCNWHGVTSGLDSCVNALVFYGNDLYVGGAFSGRVAKWNGSSLTFLSGINAEVLALAVNANGVYAGGYFTNASGQADADGIARWNGSSWNAMGSGIMITDRYLDIATTVNDVYVGGAFINAGGVSDADHIARWDGSIWHPMGNGLNDLVSTIQISGTDVYACGSFTNAGGNPLADKIARWNGTSWNNVCVEQGNGSMFFSMLLTDSYIYVCATDLNCDYAELVRYNLQNDEWENFSYPYWDQCPVNFNAIVEIGSDLYCSWANGTGGVLRWGEPSGYVEISGIPDNICEDAPPIALPTTQSGYIGDWSGEGVTNNIFNPDGLLDYVQLTFTPDAGQCVAAVDFYIYVYLITDYLEPLNSFCEVDDPISLIPYQNGINGDWSGPGVTNNTFDPSGLNGYIQLNFTPDPGECAAEATDGTFVNPAIIPEISGIQSSICEDSNPISLPTFQDGINGDWSGQGVSNNSFDPSGLNGSITLTFTPDPDECADVNTTSIQVNPVITIAITGIPNSLCQLSSPIVLPVTQSGIQGNWSGQGVTNNNFNPANLEGYITLTFTPNTGQCAYATTKSIQVYFYVPVISGIPYSICESGPPFMLPTTQSGFNGNWSGDGVSNNIFNPTGYDGVVTLTFNPVTGQCAIPVTQNIFVDPPLIPNLTGLPVSLCALSSPIELPDIQDGIEGEWSGPGVENNYFDPSDLSGEVILNFFPEPEQCALPNNTTIIVQDAVMPLVTGVPSYLCENAMPQFLPDLQNGISGYWSGPGVIDNYLNPSGQNGNIVLTFTPYASECAVSNTWIVTVGASFIPVLSGLPTAVCQTDPSIPLSSVQTGFIGTWSGPGVSNDTFQPVGLSGMIQLTFNPNANQCAVPAQGTIIVNTPTHLVLTLPDSLCQKDDPIELSPFQDSIPGVWVGPGIENNFFNPDSQIGNVVLFFIADNGACEDTAKDQIYIQTLPSFRNLNVDCDSITNTYTVSFDIIGGDPTGYMVDGVPILTGNFISQSYPFSATYYSFVLEDGSDCGPVSILGINSCICFSDAGTMNFNGAPLKICRGPKLTVAYNGDGHLDPDDLLLFVLHDNSGNQLGNVYAMSDQPVFSFVTGMLTGHTYYISSVAGTNNDSGVIDLHDPCLSVSQGVPVIFFDCEPDQQNSDPVSLEKETFNQPFKEEKDGDQNNAGGNGTNEKGQFINIPTILSSDNDLLDKQWASIIDDPYAMIKELSMYDVYGRRVYSEKDLPAFSSLITSKNNIQNSRMAPGFYVFTLEVEKGNGEIIYVNGCRIMVW